MLAVTLTPAMPASAADRISWPQVQQAAQATQNAVVRDGGTTDVAIGGKISYREVTDYAPGGNACRARYREAGMADSEPDVVTWTIIKKADKAKYRPMPPLPKAGRYPILRKASWVRLTPNPSPDSIAPVLRLTTVDPMGEISSGAANAEGMITASWTHGIEGTPASEITATLIQQPPGALILKSFSIKDLISTGPTPTMTVQVDLNRPHLTVPDFSSALPESYAKAAMNAAGNTTAAFYSMRNAANSAREMAGTMDRPELITFVRSEVAANQDFSHPPANPSTDTIVDLPDGLRLTNRNAYSGQSTIWTLTVTPDKGRVLTKKTKPSEVTPAPPWVSRAPMRLAVAGGSGSAAPRPLPRPPRRRAAWWIRRGCHRPRRSRERTTTLCDR
jgi:hypothetical protein